MCKGRAGARPARRPTCFKACHSEERRDEESAVIAAIPKVQIPRFARDDNS